MQKETKVSVIIPVFNQIESLYLTLVSFAHQTCDPSLFEVIVVDDGSKDNIQRLVQSYLATFSLKYVHQNNQGRAVARNRGVQEALGDILIFNDCDRMVSRDFIRTHLACQERASAQVAIGSIYEFFFSDLSKYRDALVEDMAQGFAKYGHFAREYSYAQTVMQMYNSDGKTDYHIPWISFFSGNVSLPRMIFEQVGGFDEAFIGWGFEHFELGLRLYRANFQFVYEPQARNFHLAHRRPANFYSTSLQTSYEYLKTKHPDQEIILLREFLRCELSLQDFEASVSGKTYIPNEHKAVYLPTPMDF